MTRTRPTRQTVRTLAIGALCAALLPALSGVAVAGCRQVGVWHKFTVCDPPTGGNPGGKRTYTPPPSPPAEVTTFNQAIAAWNKGDKVGAIRLAKQALTTARKTGNKRIERRALEIISDGYLSLARLAAMRRSHDEAGHLYRDAETYGWSLSKNFRVGDRYQKAHAKRRIYDEAARMRSRADKLRRTISLVRERVRVAIGLMNQWGTPAQRLAWLNQAKALLLGAQQLMAGVPAVAAAYPADDPRPVMPTCPDCLRQIRNEAVALVGKLQDLALREGYAPARAQAAAASSALMAAVGFDNNTRNYLRNREAQAEKSGLRRQFDTAWKAGRFKDAARAAETQTRRNPRDIGAWRNLAIAREKAGDGGAAIDAYRKLLALESSPEAWYGLGRTYRKAERKTEAEAAMREGLKHAPKDLWMNVELAQLLLDKGPAHSVEAEAVLAKALQAIPANASSRKAQDWARREHEKLKDYNGSLRHKAALMMSEVRESGPVAFVRNRLPNISLPDMGGVANRTGEAVGSAWRSTVAAVDRSRTVRLLRDAFGIKSAAPPVAAPAPPDRARFGTARDARGQARQAAGTGNEAGVAARSISPALSPVLDAATERAAYGLQAVFDRASRHPSAGGAAVSVPAAGPVDGRASRPVRRSEPPAWIVGDPGWRRLERQAAAIRNEVTTAELRRDAARERMLRTTEPEAKAKAAVVFAAARQAVTDARAEQAALTVQQDEYISLRANVREGGEEPAEDAGVGNRR